MSDSITPIEWITVGAIIAGPILAVQAQKLLENFREKRQERLSIFKTLMSTRAEKVSRNHVEALNMIDIAFYGRKVFGTRFQTKKEKAVTNAWKNYNDMLNSRQNYQSGENWNKDLENSFTRLLYVMSNSLGYDYDEVQLKRDCYRPVIHENIDMAQLEALGGLVDVLRGTRPLPVSIYPLPSAGDGSANEEQQPDEET